MSFDLHDDLEGDTPVMPIRESVGSFPSTTPVNNSINTLGQNFTAPMSNALPPARQTVGLNLSTVMGFNGMGDATEIRKLKDLKQVHSAFFKPRKGLGSIGDGIVSPNCRNKAAANAVIDRLDSFGGLKDNLFRDDTGARVRLLSDNKYDNTLLSARASRTLVNHAMNGCKDDAPDRKCEECQKEYRR